MRGLPGSQKNTVSEEWASPQCAVSKTTCKTGDQFQQRENPRISQIWGRLQSCHSELIPKSLWLPKVVPSCQMGLSCGQSRAEKSLPPSDWSLRPLGNSKKRVASSVYGKASSWNLCRSRLALSCLPSPRPSLPHHTPVQEQKAIL